VPRSALVFEGTSPGFRVRKIALASQPRKRGQDVCLDIDEGVSRESTPRLMAC
jgi:hypothetical protein